MTASPWHVATMTGSVAELHSTHWPDPVQRTVWRMVPTRAALVLGSTQRRLSDELAVPASRRGMDVVVRGSGGGAVLVEPGAMVWIDLVVSRSDPLWVEDVSRSSTWLGDVWVEALRSLGVPAAVAPGPYDAGRWGSLVCFAGSAPGEVSALGAGEGGPKLVGISQRRTRLGARFQSMVHLRFDPSGLTGLLVDVVDHGDRISLAEAVASSTMVVDSSEDDVVGAFLGALDGLTGGPV